MVFNAAMKPVEALGSGHADIGFFAIDPARGNEIAFTDAYLLVEGCYMVNEASPVTSYGEVDRGDHTIVVGQGSAYDLCLSREIKAATLVRAANSQAVVDTLVAHAWLYNRGDPAQDKLLETDVPPIKNPARYVTATEFALPSEEAEFSVNWPERKERGSVCCIVNLRGHRIAEFRFDERIGFSVLAATGNRLARPLARDL